MKLKKLVPFLLLLIFCFTSYAHENRCVIVGQNAKEEKTTFVLEMSEDNWKNVHINENGEVYIRAEKIIVIPNNCLNEQGFYPFEGDVTSCGSKVSKPKTWQCPYCHHWWELGEKCKYEDCPTNRWEKEEK